MAFPSFYLSLVEKQRKKTDTTSRLLVIRRRSIVEYTVLIASIYYSIEE